MSTRLISLALGEEYVSPDEEDLIAHIKHIGIARLARTYPPNTILTRRDVHPKAHGCVRAEFIIGEDVPPALRHGIFQTPRAFNAWIRFSAGRPTMHTDQELDTHGMAIKLMGVEGIKILNGDTAEKRTQDFVMASAPAFFIRNLEEYLSFEEADFHFLPEGLRQRINVAIHFALRAEIAELMALQQAQNLHVTNPLQIQYWSQTPYKLGVRAIKFSVKPVLSQHDYKPETLGNDYLQEAMTSHLQSEDIWFDFLIQEQTDSKAMPVEDAVVVWDEKLSPFQKVAAIRIPKQTFASREQFRFAEHLSFTPWHSLPDHRPLGSINRGRRAIYEAIAYARNAMNAVVYHEPTGEEVFPQTS